MSHMRSRATRWCLRLVAVVVAAGGFGLLQAAPAAAIVCGLESVPGQVINCTPSVKLLINGSDFSNLLRVTPTSAKSFQVAPIEPILISNLIDIRSFFVTSNADPFVDYGFGVKNLTAAAFDYDFTFTQPFVGGPFTTLATSHSGSVTDSSNTFVGTDGTVTITAPEGFVHQPFVDLSNVDGLNPGCVVATGAGGSGNCPSSGLSATVPVVTGATGLLGVEVHFTLSPGDIYTVNGRAELLNGVPEPATILLLTGGVVGLAVLRRRPSASTRG